MMSIVIVVLASLSVALLTLFSGFGLGTLLMPVFAIFFPLEAAIAATAVVHLLNNIFKLFLVGRYADKGVVIRFALPGAIAAMGGAWMLVALSEMPRMFSYTLGSKTMTVSPLNLVLAVLIGFFSLFELLPSLRKLEFDRRHLIAGGALSGFFGGLSGHQGALRSAFLSKVNLDSKSFIGTGTVCAVVVDVVRLLVYGAALFSTHFLTLDQTHVRLVFFASLAAFLGSFVGSRLMHKVAIESIRTVIGVMLLGLAVILGMGII